MLSSGPRRAHSVYKKVLTQVFLDIKGEDDKAKRDMVANQAHKTGNDFKIVPNSKSIINNTANEK